MLSPFPGMDPYLEARTLWPGVHQRLITYIADDLQKHVRPKYHARIGERIYLVSPPGTMYPDIALIERPLRVPAPAGVAVPPHTADTPYKLIIHESEIREPYLEIVHTAQGEVVTVIEILSPANKTAGEGQDLYQRKQHEILRSQAHLVEIDLLKRGKHTVAPPLSELDQLPPYRYLVSVSRFPNRREFDVYTFALPDRLPLCSIPLLPEDPDVIMDLPAAFHRCYDNGGYTEFVDYSQPPQTDLTEDEQVWLMARLADQPEPTTPA